MLPRNAANCGLRTSTLGKWLTTSLRHAHAHAHAHARPPAQIAAADCTPAGYTFSHQGYFAGSIAKGLSDSDELCSVQGLPRAVGEEGGGRI